MKKLFIFLCSALTLTGCASMSGGLVMPSMSDKDYYEASPETREAYLKNIQEEDNLIGLKKDTEYLAGRPVFYGDSSTGYTIQWNKKLALVAVYPGHTTGMMGMESAALLVFKADSKGNIHYQNQGGVEKPTTLLSNTSTQEGVGRLFVKGGFQILGAGVNGLGAAIVQSNAACKGDGCGNGGDNVTLIENVIQARSYSDSQSGSKVDFKADLGCTNCK